MEQRVYQTLTIGIDLLKVERCDIKDMDLEHYYKLRTSLRDYGQLRNILVDEQYNVVEGRKIAGVMRELGYKSIEVKILPADHVIARLNLDSEYSTFDFVKVSIQLSKDFDLEKKDWLKDKLPFKNVDIDDYIEGLQFSFDKFNEQKNQKQGSLFDVFTESKPAEETKVTKKAVQATVQTLFDEIPPATDTKVEEEALELKVEEEVKVITEVKLTEASLMPDGSVGIGFTIVDQENQYVEVTLSEEPKVIVPVQEETFADKRAREVREAAEREKQTNGSTE